ncbi:MAG TPA: dihydrodipicolinate synthase family protein, partial [Streptomyces sp.]|nr:dihydrodipicolinate synthase family protein [Streptomyces sp.]
EPDIVWLCGVAEVWAPYFAVSGARGFTSGLANVDPRRSVALFRALKENRNADVEELRQGVRQFEELRNLDGGRNNVSVVKEALAQLGLCRRDVRPPISPVNAADRERVAHVLTEWGLRPGPGQQAGPS